MATIIKECKYFRVVIWRKLHNIEKSDEIWDIFKIPAFLYIEFFIG